MARIGVRFARTALLATLSVSGLALAAPGFAQTPADAAAENSDDQGNEIIITARRSSERLQDVPIAVTVLNAEKLERENIDDLGDIAEKTVGFAFENFTGPLAQPVIRGQTNLRTTSPVQNVSTVLNGIYIQRGYFVDQGLLDLEQVEIIKGPQSALYGRNAFAGVISLTTRTPDLDQISGRVTGTVGSDKRYEIKGGVNVPVVPGVFAIYAAAGYSTFDGTWVNNAPLANAAGANTRGKLGGYEKKAYQLGAKLKIGEAVTLEGMYIRTERDLEQNPAYTLSTAGLTAPINTLNASPTGVGAARQNRLWVGLLPATVPLFPGEARPAGLVIDPRAFGLRGPSDIWMGKLVVDNGGPVAFEALYGHTEANIQARGSAQRDPTTAVAFSLAPGILPVVNYGNVFDSSGSGSRFNSDSIEAKMMFKGNDQLSGFVGVNFSRTFDVDSNGSEFGPVNSLVEPDPASFYPVSPGAVVPATTPLFARNTLFRRVESVFSAFGYVKWKPVEQLSITLEGRWTQEDQKGSDLFAVDRNPATGASTGTIAATTPTVFRKANFFTPRGSITYKFDDDHNVYLSAGRGYKSGGINGVAANYRRTSTVNGQPVVDFITVGEALPAARAGATAVAYAQLTAGTASLSSLQERYDAETNWTYEIGTKNRFFGGALTLNLTAFLTEWNNIQSNAVRLQPDGTAPLSFAAIVPSLIGNVGNARVYGVEVEGSWKVVPSLRLDFGASWNHARYKNGVFSQRIGASGNCDGVVCAPVTVPGFAYPVLPIGGKQLERTPEFDALVGLNFDTKFSNGWGFFARADVTYQTKQFADEANLAFIPSRTLVNASTGVNIGKLNLQLWVKNLFDKTYVTSALFLVGTGGAGSASYVPILGERRTGGLTASFKF